MTVQDSAPSGGLKVFARVGFGIQGGLGMQRLRIRGLGLGFQVGPETGPNETAGRKAKLRSTLSPCPLETTLNPKTLNPGRP